MVARFNVLHVSKYIKNAGPLHLSRKRIIKENTRKLYSKATPLYKHRMKGQNSCNYGNRNSKNNNR
jgi:hypothetical protein